MTDVIIALAYLWIGCLLCSLHIAWSKNFPDHWLATDPVGSSSLVTAWLPVIPFLAFWILRRLLREHLELQQRGSLARATLIRGIENRADKILIPRTVHVPWFLLAFGTLIVAIVRYKQTGLPQDHISWWAVTVCGLWLVFCGRMR